METSCESNYFLDPNFASKLYDRYGQIKEIANKIKFIIHEFQKSKKINNLRTCGSKNNLKANELREEANVYFAIKDQPMLLHALKLYNESMCYSEGDNIAIGYANRSAVYFELKEYEICLENIRLAKQNGLLENLIPELSKRENDCLEQLRMPSVGKKEEEEERENELNIKLGVEPNQKIPFAASCLKLKTDSVYGRYIVATEDINPGVILAIESPFAAVLKNDCAYQRCTYCFKNKHFNLIPCQNCSKAMFCSDACLQNANKSFHQYECPIIDCLWNVEGQLTMRAYLKAIHSFNSVQELIGFYKSKNLHDLTVFSFDHSKELSSQQLYQQIHCLSTNQEIRPQIDLFTHGMIAALFYYQLINYTSFKDLVTEDVENYLIELMFHIELITTINSFHFDDLSSVLDGPVIGTGIYQFSSLINHSCCPNVSPKFYNTKLVLHTTQRIARGESVSISYNGSHLFLPKQERQLFLNGKYHFKCQCIACENGLPLLSNMMLANIPEIHSNNQRIILDRVCAEDIYQKCCLYLLRFYHHYPCKEVYSVQKCLSKVLSYLLTNGNIGMELTIPKLGKRNPEDIIL